jgi:uncharacterized membrane protein
VTVIVLEPIELVFATLGPKPEADAAMERLVQLNRSGSIELISATIVAKDEKSKIEVQDAPDLLQAEAPLLGIPAGGPVSQFAGIGGVLGAAVSGVVPGHKAGRVAKVGVPERHLEELGQELAPGRSALLALVEEEAVEQVVRELHPLVSSLRRFILESGVPESDAGPAEERSELWPP